VDPLLLRLQLLLAALGVLGVAAAEPAALGEQIARAALGVLVVFVTAAIPTRIVIRYASLAYGFGFLLLILVLIPGVGITPDGLRAQRWIAVGPVALQPAEFMKVIVIAYLAAFFHHHVGRWQIWRPIVITTVAAVPIVVQPNVSSALFLFGLAYAMVIFAGTNSQRLIAIGIMTALVIAVAGGPYLDRLEYVGDRVDGFWALLRGERNVEVNYQPERARLAIREAGAFGIGPGRPVRVPAAATDMIAIAIAQSLGLPGVTALVIGFALLVARILAIARRARGPAALLAGGAAAYVGAQASLNLLVAVGLLPVTGVPLPLVSYGLNSLLSVSIALGFVHASYREARAAGAFA
jgi:cell division protein FtsW